MRLRLRVLRLGSQFRFEREGNVSVAGVSSNPFLEYGMQNLQTRMQQAKQEFQQLGQDLSSGNLSAARSDFSALQQASPQASASSSQSSNPISQDFTQLGNDLQAGNTTAAQQDYAKIQQDFQSQAPQAQGHHHHHHHGASSGAGDITQTLDQLGQALGSGNLSGAQQAYTSLEQEFQQFAQSNGALLTDATTSSSGASGISVSA